MSRIKLKISEQLLLQYTLRLGKEPMLLGATVEQAGPMRTLVLEVHMPDAPEGADQATPTYTRISNGPDPVQITGVTWYKNGQLVAIDRPKPDERFGGVLMLFAALILAIVVGVWAVLDRSWQMLLLAVAVALAVLAMNPSIH